MKTNRLKITSAVLAFAFLLPLIAHSQKVSVDWDHNVQNFSAFKTYAWTKPVRPTANSFMNQRIIAAIDEQLSAKGLQKVEGPADIHVTYNAGVRRERSATVMGTGGFRMGGMASINQNINNVGTLVVDISNAKTNQLLWRGTSTDTLSDKPDKNSKKIDKAVSKMFKKYPPPPSM